jgi:hypothetical protein
MNMAIGDINAVNGVVVAGQIQEFIHELSSELRKDAREIQRDARRAELLQALESAQHLRDKADSVLKGAVIGGAITMAGAVGQFDAAGDFRTSLSEVPHPGFGNGPIAELNGINNQAQANVQKFGSLSSLGGSVNQVFNAIGDHDEVLSQQSQARSKAAEAQANEAETDLQAIEKVDDSGKDLLQQISQNQHAGMMAILSRQ